MLPLAKELIFVSALLIGVPFVVMTILVIMLRRSYGVDKYGRILYKPDWFLLLNGLLDRSVLFFAAVYWVAWIIRVVVYFRHRSV